MAEHIGILEEWIKDDFGVPEQPFLLNVVGILDEDEGNFVIEISVRDNKGKQVTESTVKAQVTNPLGLEIAILPAVVSYGLCVGTGITHAVIDVTMECDRDSREAQPKMGRRERIRNIFGRFLDRKSDIKVAAKSSLVKCISVLVGGAAAGS